ncbi:MAG: hypothetical protein IJC48_02120 [Clostridia bacterium]|nr:hypothetical protein [Clostridia bacterium]
MAHERLFHKIERLSMTLERMQLDEYLKFVSDKKRMLLMALMGGVMRGVGFMFGFSVIGAIVVTLLRGLLYDSIPGIGSFFAEVMNEIETRTR